MHNRDIWVFSIFILGNVLNSSAVWGWHERLVKTQCFIRENTWHVGEGKHRRVILRELRTDVKKWDRSLQILWGSRQSPICQAPLPALPRDPCLQLLQTVLAIKCVPSLVTFTTANFPKKDPTCALISYGIHDLGDQRVACWWPSQTLVVGLQLNTMAAQGNPTPKRSSFLPGCGTHRKG